MSYLQKKKLAFLSIVNQIKGFVRGVVGRPPLTLPNCVDNKSLIDYKIYGDSVQDNRNLLLYDIRTTTSGGVTWTVNENRSITVSNTPSAWSGFALIDQVLDSDWVGKTLTFYYTGVDIANAFPVINFYRVDGTRFTGNIFNHMLTSSDTLYIFTVPDEAVKIAITLQRSSNNVECTGTFYPMLLMGEYTADSIPSFADTIPAPDNPMEVQSVGEKTKNLWSFGDKYVSGDNNYQSNSWEVNLTPNVTYTFSAYYEQVGYLTYAGIGVRDKSNTSIATTKASNAVSGHLSTSFTVPEDGIVKLLLFSNTRPAVGGTTSCNFTDIQVEEGDTATDYEPYGYKIPVIARGKNIAFDVNGRDCAVGETSGGVVGFKSSTLEKGKTYTLSFDTENTGGRVQLVTYNRPLTMVSSSMATANGTRQSFTFTMTDDFYRSYAVTWVQLRADSTANSGLCSNVMVEESSIATPYELYVEPVTTNIYTKEPIRKIFNGANEYSDIIDFSNKKVIRNIASINATRSNWLETLDGSGGKYVTKTYNIQNRPAIDYGEGYNCLCNREVAQKRNAIYSYGYQGISAGGQRIRFYRPELTDLSLDEFKNWVDENPMLIDYILATPEEELLEYVPTLPTVKGTTIYEIDTTVQPSKMEVEYYSTSKE